MQLSCPFVVVRSEYLLPEDRKIEYALGKSNESLKISFANSTNWIDIRCTA